MRALTKRGGGEGGRRRAAAAAAAAGTFIISGRARAHVTLTCALSQMRAPALCARAPGITSARLSLSLSQTTSTRAHNTPGVLAKISRETTLFLFSEPGLLLLLLRERIDSRGGPARSSFFFAFLRSTCACVCVCGYVDDDDDDDDEEVDGGGSE